MDCRRKTPALGLIMALLAVGCGQRDEPEPPARPVRAIRVGDVKALSGRPIPGRAAAAVLVAFIVVALFNTFRPPLIILCVIPFAMIGITVGLLVTGQPFGFLALLGAMSLAFGTILTMVLLPVLYTVFFRVPSPAK